MPQALNPCQDAAFGAQSVAYTGTAGSTTGWSYGPTKVLVWATTDCYVKVGNEATATTANTPIPQYTPVEFTIPNPPGAGAGTWRVSAIQISAGGTLYAKPMQD
jgi:hypothetical protein